MAPFFLKERKLSERLRVMAFTLLTPFYFLKAGSLVKFNTVISSAGLIAIFLGIKMLTKSVGIYPLTKVFRFGEREAIYTTLMMSTGLTFGTISALFGLTNGIINQDQYTILVTAVIGSALVPTMIAQTWFQPKQSSLETTVSEYSP
jgi:Kef-type K+ transport system membrane component KefB